MKTVEDDPMFDKKRAQKKLRAFVEGNPDVIAKKATMMVEHFHEQVIAKKSWGQGSCDGGYGQHSEMYRILLCDQQVSRRQA